MVSSVLKQNKQIPTFGIQVNHLIIEFGIYTNKPELDFLVICVMRRMYLDVDRQNRERVERDIAAKFPHLNVVYDLRVRCEDEKEMPDFLLMFFEWIKESRCSFVRNCNDSIQGLRREWNRE